MSAPERERDTLRDRRVLLTAATGGVGQELARALARRGCHLVLSGRSPARLALLADELRAGAPGATVAAIAADLAEPSAVDALAAGAVERLGGIDVLVNCAGVFQVASLADSSLADFERVFAVNVRAPFLLTRALAPAMAARGWGRIVNVGSSSAYAGFRDTALYCASKHALLGLSRATHDELRDRGVRTFCISPGSIKTEMGRHVPRQLWETFLEPAEVAEYVCFAIAFDSTLVTEEVRLNRLHLATA